MSLAAVRASIESGDSSELARTAHKLRGNAANLGATRVSGICEELEQRGRDRSARDSSELLASLGTALDDTMSLLRKQLLPVA
jgi:HPt (histidine-containing phosphotransfer) domain-containing protein